MITGALLRIHVRTMLVVPLGMANQNNKASKTEQPNPNTYFRIVSSSNFKAPATDFVELATLKAK